MGRGSNNSLSSNTLSRTKTTNVKSALSYEEFKKEKLNVHLIEGEKEVEALVAHFAEIDPESVAFDMETASKNGSYGSRNGTIRLMQFGLDNEEAGISPEQFLIDCFKVTPSKLVPFLRSGKVEKQIHNLRFEQEWSLDHLGVSIGNIYDTFIAWRTIQKHLGKMDPEQAQSIVAGWEKHANNLGVITDKVLGLKLPKTEQSGEWSRQILTLDQRVYAALDVAGLPLITPITKAIALEIGCDSEIDRLITEAKDSVAIMVNKHQIASKDDLARVRHAIRRSQTLEELQEVFDLSRQMTIAGTNWKAVKKSVRDKARVLENAPVELDLDKSPF